MSEEFIILIKYKEFDVLVKEVKGKYQVGMRGKNNIPVWLVNGSYASFDLARKSGKEYACIMIDKMYVGRKTKK
jgi:hypothetical protein